MKLSQRTALYARVSSLSLPKFPYPYLTVIRSTRSHWDSKISEWRCSLDHS
jgi:hypothetical protein